MRISFFKTENKEISVFFMIYYNNNKVLKNPINLALAMERSNRILFVRALRGWPLWRWRRGGQPGSREGPGQSVSPLSSPGGENISDRKNISGRGAGTAWGGSQGCFDGGKIYNPHSEKEVPNYGLFMYLC